MVTLYGYAVLAVTLISMTALFGSTGLFNFTIICMDPKERGVNESRFYTPQEEGWLMASPATGLIVGSVPVIYLTDQLGMRLSFPLFGFISALSTMLLPLLADRIYPAIVLRTLQGMSLASAFVAIGNVPIDYGGTNGKALFLSLLSLCYQLGPILAIPTSAAFCSSAFGWRGVYYVFGAISLVAFGFFFVIYRNVTHTHGELKVLRPKEVPPYRAIFTNASVWGIFINGVGDALAYIVFAIYGPIYVNKVLDFDVNQTGALVALPYVASMICKTTAGVLIHKTSFKTSRRAIFHSNTISLGIISLNFLVLVALPSGSGIIAEFFIVFTIVLDGLHYIAMMCAAQIIACQYTHVLSSAMAALESLFMLMLPQFVSAVAPNHSAAEWAHVFYFTAGFIMVTNVLFGFLTKVEAAEWTKDDYEDDTQA